MKFLQNLGGGIVAGYMGNPEIIGTVPFVSGQSPSPVSSHETFYTLSSTAYKDLYDYYGYQMNMPFGQMFYRPSVTERPLEFDTTEIDEHLGIYEFLNDNNYNSFMTKIKAVFEKYKTSCNPKNKKLLMFTDKCDGKFGNEFTHGGYECGEDGKWSQKCAPAYCDEGYLFDSDKKICYVDDCKIDFILDFKTALYIIFPIPSIILIIIIVGINIYTQRTKKMVTFGQVGNINYPGTNSQGNIN